MLIGNVEMRHKNDLIFCDSAIHFLDSSKVYAFGNIHIQKPDTMDIYSDYLIYYEQTKTALFRSNVFLKDSSGTLKTDSLNYDLNKDIGHFWGGGVFEDDSSVLESERGTYFHKDNIAYFNKNVQLTATDFELFTDSLKYDTKKKIAYFVTATKIIDKDNVIYTESGFYNTKTKDASFGKNTKMEGETGTIEANEINYDSKEKKAIAIGNVVWEDTVEQITIYSDYSEYYDSIDYTMATKDPLLIDINDEDTLFLSADTLITFKGLKPKKQYLNDSIIKTAYDSVRIFKAFKNVKIFQGRMSGICDSLYFSYVDSVFRFYYNPILWVDTSQFYGDSIQVFTKRQKADKIGLYNNAIVIHSKDMEIYNQIKGRSIYGFFKNDTLNRVDVNGNGESIYYVQDDSNAYVGSNKTLCSEMKIYFKDEDVDKILFYTRPEAIFTPMQDINPSINILPGFHWDFDKKPKSKFDIVRNKNHFQLLRLGQMNTSSLSDSSIYTSNNNNNDSIKGIKNFIKDTIQIGTHELIDNQETIEKKANTPSLPMNKEKKNAIRNRKRSPE